MVSRKLVKLLRFFMPIVFLWLVCALAVRAQTLLVGDSISHLPLGEHSLVYHDHSGKLEISDVLALDDHQFKPNGKPGFNFGIHRGAFWIKIKLASPDSVTKPLVIELVNPNIHEVSFFTVEGVVVVDTFSSGTAYPFSHRIVQHQNLMYPLSLQGPGSVTCYIHIKPLLHSTNFNLFLWDAPLRTEYALYESRYINYFFFLNTTFLVILGIVLWITRQRRHWTFFLYVSVGILYIYSDVGLAFKNLWPDIPAMQRIANFVLTNSYLIAGVSFFRGYFTTRRLLPHVDRVARWLIILAAVFIPITLSYPWLPTAVSRITISANTVLFTCTGGVVMYILAVLLIHSRNKTETIWFLIGFSLHAVSIFTASLRQLGLYNNGTELRSADLYPIFIFTTHTQNMMFWAMLWELLVVFSLMLYRFKVLYEDNNRMIMELADQRERDMRMLLTGIERERQRIAQELHDGSGVQLSALRMKLTLLEERFRLHEEKRKVREIMADLDKTQQEIRSISHNLMPKTLSKLGLIPAIDELVNSLKAAYPAIKISFYRQSVTLGFSETARVNIYRIVQELLNNAIRHAAATEISLQLINHGDTLVISVEDDGKGFDPQHVAANGIGLQSMQSRASVMGGQLTVDSGKKRGTFISVALPIDSISAGS
ncbi:MAG TPA: 7TM-DISM domain-containing protein [Parapedobacter sp.]|uniref:sensor histidine kinase n=1 Tax=Parapedobacter sp. TaxID=1958893 RepID=UPI002CD977EE|nr:7TM-DISM domain-containing protein [Parapedobacter sp.]HWK58878.1 7TM-DISM domain-containing protein [Parapedobacter sp.]